MVLSVSKLIFLAPIVSYLVSTRGPTLLVKLKYTNLRNEDIYSMIVFGSLIYGSMNYIFIDKSGLDNLSSILVFPLIYILSLIVRGLLFTCKTLELKKNIFLFFSITLTNVLSFLLINKLILYFRTQAIFFLCIYFVFIIYYLLKRIIIIS